MVIQTNLPPISVEKTIKTVERDGKFMPTVVSKDSGKVIKLHKAHAQEKELSLSSKDAVYLAWSDGEEDVNELHSIVDEAVKASTIRNWLSKWRKESGLPRIAKA